MSVHMQHYPPVPNVPQPPEQPATPDPNIVATRFMADLYNVQNVLASLGHYYGRPDLLLSAQRLIMG